MPGNYGVKKCVGYSGYICDKIFKCKGSCHKRCKYCAKAHRKLLHRKYHPLLPETFECPGYAGHKCGAVVSRGLGNQARKRCPSCARTIVGLRRTKKFLTLRQRRTNAARSRGLYYRKRKEKIEYMAAYRKKTREVQTVRNHHLAAFKLHEGRRIYDGMPFHDAWNPDKGGSYKAGGQWIIDNLGCRPDGCTLHIIEHAKGFVPGNLEWTHPKRQVNQQMFKIIAQQRHQIKQLNRQLVEARQILALAA